MADAQQPGTPATQGQKRDFAIPDSVRAAFPELIDLISSSESMNDDERQYWFDILPVMTAEQIENLRSILANERTKLAEIDAKYANQSQATASGEDMVKNRKANREDLLAKEQTDQSVEEGHEEDLLKKINEL